MRLLLDSHVALWWLGDDGRLGRTAHTSIATAAEVFVSVVTPWELGIKKASGKLTLPENLVAELRSTGFELLTIQATHAQAAPALVAHHGDPFDRMIIAQAISEQLTIVTADEQFKLYNVELIDASR